MAEGRGVGDRGELSGGPSLEAGGTSSCGPVSTGSAVCLCSARSSTFSGIGADELSTGETIVGSETDWDIVCSSIASWYSSSSSSEGRFLSACFPLATADGPAAGKDEDEEEGTASSFEGMDTIGALDQRLRCRHDL